MRKLSFENIRTLVAVQILMLICMIRLYVSAMCIPSFIFKIFCYNLSFFYELIRLCLGTLDLL